jgi:oligopeptide transport system ATP-binding protein
VQVRDLKKHYPISSGILRRQTGAVRAVDGVSFEIEAGETFAVVGESGCGKTTLGKTVARLHAPTSGEIRFDGEEIGSLGKRSLKPYRKNIQVVYQDPSSSLNPRRRIGKIIEEPLVVHGIGDGAERRDRVSEVMERVDLPEEFRYRYPNALSGGQKQRVAIARALVLNPKFVVLDEPTSALDVSVQAKFISLLRELQADLGLTYLVISHNLSLVKNIADRIGVMYLGKFMEVAESDALFERSLNPYTEQLLSAIPVVDADESELKPEKIDIRGEPPDPADPPDGCSFHPRCHRVFEACEHVEPELTEDRAGHAVRCLLYEGGHDDAVSDHVSDGELRRLRNGDG